MELKEGQKISLSWGAKGKKVNATVVKLFSATVRLGFTSERGKKVMVVRKRHQLDTSR